MSIVAENICVSLGRTKILRGLDLTAKAGEVTVVVGPNGSGKTTLLRALNADVPYEGRVAINGQNTRDLSAHAFAQLRAVLPQASAMSFPFTVLEVVRLGLTAGVPQGISENSNRLPLQALQRVGLDGLEGRMFQDLSGGEKQRVQLARVLVQIWEPVLNGVPRWLFLDEPISALDIGHQLLVMRIAQDFAKAEGGVLAVLHDLNLTAMIADQVILMHRGQVLARGRAETVLRDDTLSTAYGCDIKTNTAPASSMPWLLPQSAGLPHPVAAE